MNPPLKPIQTSGTCHAWGNPDRKSKNIFLQLDLGTESPPYPGLVIISDEDCLNAVATPVKDLRKELAQLLARSPKRATVHWKLEQDEKELARLLSALTLHPLFIG